MNFTQGILKKIKHCIVSSLLIFKINPFWGPVLGFRCCPGFPLVAVRGGHSLPWCQGSRERAQQLWLMGLTAPQQWDLPGPGIEPVPLGSPALGGRSATFFMSATWEALLSFMTKYNPVWMDPILFVPSSDGGHLFWMVSTFWLFMNNAKLLLYETHSRKTSP